MKNLEESESMLEQRRDFSRDGSSTDGALSQNAAILYQ